MSIDVGRRRIRETIFRRHLVVARFRSRGGRRILRRRLVIRGPRVRKERVIVPLRGYVVLVSPSPRSRGRVVGRTPRSWIAIDVQLIVILMRVAGVLVEPIPTITNERSALRELLRLLHGAGVASPERR